MQVKLVGYTVPTWDGPPSQIAGDMAAVCTNSNNPQRALKGAILCGHESVLQHVSFTFLISGVSRAFLAQISRHRIASFSVQSQRYVNMERNGVIVPKTIQADASALDVFTEAITKVMKAYRELVWLGIPKEDARFVLPQGIQTTIGMTMNVRELHHFLGLRMCNRAQWEIREAADKIYRIIKDIDPVLIEGAGPGCWRGSCPQGKMSCGKPRERV